MEKNCKPPDCPCWRLLSRVGQIVMPTLLILKVFIEGMKTLGTTYSDYKIIVLNNKMVFFIALMVFIAVTNTMLGCAAH